ncbi:phage gp6-like head-tail connector protein [Chengkuizengella sp. YPA3-1-1]|uniref:Phage gp6-like head-tail connector protein n=2 Tax=Chengkuizengella marina TaxID=2507566 RepID=A0A6N9Q7Z3_9BACL|nr:phage gp6-like head-tail connector protein [Chengkuizengella marina]
MTNEELLIECKIGLSISLQDSAQDGILNQKLLAVKSYMKNAGVSEEKMNDDLAVGVIVMGVTDLWQMESGVVRFSPAFNTLLTQLTYDEVEE